MTTDQTAGLMLILIAAAALAWGLFDACRAANRRHDAETARKAAAFEEHLQVRHDLSAATIAHITDVDPVALASPDPVRRWNDDRFDFNLARRELVADPLAREAANVVPGPWGPRVVPPQRDGGGS